MKTPATTSAARLADRYIRCEDFSSRIDGVELAPEIWAVFAQLAQARNAPELARHLKLDIEAVNASLRRLVRRKLIRKHVLAWRDYAASVAPATVTTTHFEGSTAPFMEACPPAEKPPAPAPVSALSRPPFFAGDATAPAAPRATPIISLRIASSKTSARPSPAISFRLAAPAASAGLKLRPIIDAIGARAGGGVAGQLLVYRVFLQIPTELMQAAGVQSLSLVDNDFILRHPALRTALAEAARRHAGIDIETLSAA